MPAWGNTDNHNKKPKWAVERETRENAQLTISSGNTAGNNIITLSYNDGAGNNVANVGVAAGQYVYFWANGTAVGGGGQQGNGIPGFFESNTTVATVSGNTITLTQNLFSVVNAGWVAEFDKAISYNSNKYSEVNYNSDTVLVTPTRASNTAGSGANLASGITQAQVGNLNVGWTHIQKKTNNDGTVRYLKETLVALANPTASNTASGNTSAGYFLSGV